MNERITLVSLFNQMSLDKINCIIKDIKDPLCNVPFGKNVDNREEVDTLPYHFTIFSWSIKKEKEVMDFLDNISFEPFKVLIEKIEIVNGNEDNFELRFCIRNNTQLYEIQNKLFSKYNSKYYIPDNFNFHITIHIDKDYNRIVSIKEKILRNFKPFELEIDTLGLYEIYPAKLVKKNESTKKSCKILGYK